MASESISAPRRNIELKARLPDLAAARHTAEELATERIGFQRQIDTYFRCSTGRLKLREIDDQMAQLVAYHRDDLSGPKASDYRLVPVPDSAALREALEQSLGILTVVDKRREIFLYNNVRIHLDEVVGLGIFLEFEAVLDAKNSAEEGETRIAYLTNSFKIESADLLEGSYSDMQLSHIAETDI